MLLTLSPDVLAITEFEEIGFVDAPQLTSLEYRIHLPPTTDVIPALSGLHTPKLCRLKTTGGSLELLKTFIRPTLTSLDMSNWLRRDWGLATELLESLSALRTLSLRFKSDDTHPAGRMPSKRITLPNLTSLVLYDEEMPTGISKLLEHITCPLLANLKCWSGITEARSDRTLDKSLMKALKTKMHTTALSTTFIPRTIAFLDSLFTEDDEDDEFITIGVWEAEQATNKLRDPLKWEPESGSFIASRLRDERSILANALPIFNLDHVTNMCVHYTICSSSQALWRRLFLSTPNLHRLHVRGLWLADVLKTPNPGEPESPVLPKMKILSLSMDGISFIEMKPTLRASLAPLVSSLEARQTALPRPAAALDRFKVILPYYRTQDYTKEDHQFLTDAKIARVIQVHKERDRD